MQSLIELLFVLWCDCYSGFFKNRVQMSKVAGHLRVTQNGCLLWLLGFSTTCTRLKASPVNIFPSCRGNLVAAQDICDQDLNASTFRTYLYLVKTGKAVGPRDVMRGADLSSPSVAYRNLQKLMNLGLVEKDTFGNYVAKERMAVKGYFWWGRSLIPRFLVFGLVFVGVLAAEIAIAVPHLVIGDPVERSFWLLTGLTVIAAALFLLEGLRWKRQSPHTS